MDVMPTEEELDPELVKDSLDAIATELVLELDERCEFDLDEIVEDAVPAAEEVAPELVDDSFGVEDAELVVIELDASCDLDLENTVEDAVPVAGEVDPEFVKDSLDIEDAVFEAIELDESYESDSEETVGNGLTLLELSWADFDRVELEAVVLLDDDLLGPDKGIGGDVDGRNPGVGRYDVGGT